MAFAGGPIVAGYKHLYRFSFSDTGYWMPCLKYLESIVTIRNGAFKFVFLRPTSHLIAPYR